ncbi:MAG: response regulator transcription factor [Chloroflexi bacterium]|nr:response regulator transcription factor [Chloroflexota bacterium]
MTEDIHVLIMEDDPYSRDLMTLMLTRDWRTRVIGEVDDDHGLRRLLAENIKPIDVIILDTEIPGDPEWPDRAIDKIRQIQDPPAVLYLGTSTNPELLKLIVKDEDFGGYAIKSEILYGLGAGISYIASGKHVVTSSILKTALDQRITLPDDTLVLDGTKILEHFTSRESQIVRLGVLLNQAQRDVADELVVSPEWVSEVVSKAYGKLGMHEILSGEVTLETYFDDPAILERWGSVLHTHDGKKGDGHTRKTPWMSTLAYHLLTIPDVDEL